MKNNEMGVETVSHFLGSEEVQFSLGLDEVSREDIAPIPEEQGMDDLLPELEAIRAMLTDNQDGSRRGEQN